MNDYTKLIDIARHFWVLAGRVDKMPLVTLIEPNGANLAVTTTIHAANANHLFYVDWFTWWHIGAASTAVNYWDLQINDSVTARNAGFSFSLPPGVVAGNPQQTIKDRFLFGLHLAKIAAPGNMYYVGQSFRFDFS